MSLCAGCPVSGRWRGLSSLVFIVMLSACETTQSLYEWGTYDASVKRVASESDGFDLQAEIARLSAEMRRATDISREVPPGFRIHLAYLYLLQGDQASALELLDVEKSRFPESEVFIDGLMTRVANQPGLSGKADRSESK